MPNSTKFSQSVPEHDIRNRMRNHTRISRTRWGREAFGMGKAGTQWLIHYATSRRAAGSSPDMVNYFFTIYLILPASLGPGVYLTCSRNECQKQKNVSGE
jgi:hypothetical protein